MVSVEALLRWERPDYGLVGPDEFIPTGGGDGAHCPIGAWVLEQACVQLAAVAAYCAVPIPWRSISRSVSFWHPISSGRSVMSCVAPEFGPESVRRELTESVFMGDAEYFGLTLREARRILGWFCQSMTLAPAIRRRVT